MSETLEGPFDFLDFWTEWQVKGRLPLEALGAGRHQHTVRGQPATHS